MTRIDIAAGQAAIRFESDRDGWLRQIGFRPVPADGPGIEPGPFPAEAFPLAYPAWGQDTSATVALRLTSHDGRPGCYPVLTGHERNGQEHRIRLADAALALTIDLCLRTYPDGVIEQWAEIRHDQPGPVTLHQAAAAAPALHAPQPWLTRFDGDWAAEWTPATIPLAMGATVIQSSGAVRPHLQASPFFLIAPDGRASEDHGTVLAGGLAWGGGVTLAFERSVRQPGLLRAVCGHNPGGYVLDPGEVFRTPSMVWAWSADGTRSLTHRLHRWVRAHVLRDGDQIRPTVFNTWEATYFSFDADRLTGMMAGAASLGAELFLLDDGWFGTEFPRDDDTAGLGDWAPDRAKLPAGLGGLTDAAAANGLRFGLWIEPEMVNPSSRLYRHHPGWVVSEPGRQRREERNQFVLDLCQPEVRQFVTRTVDDLLTGCPGISYLKWDANRDISEPGSAGLEAGKQGNLWFDTVQARWQVMAAAAERWPETTMMLCASGGGRTDLGTLRWFHEVWLSDNTEAAARLRMQWAASHFLPPQVIGAHVTRWGAQDLAFACAVAMSARFGFDLDPDTLSPAELAVCQRAAARYREVRDLVQLGDLFRLIGPGEPGGRVALGYADPARRRWVVFGYQLDEAAAEPDVRCPLAGLDDGLSYRVRQLSLTGDSPADGGAHDGGEGQDDDDGGPGSIKSGAQLLADGLPWPLAASRTAVIWLLDAEVDETSAR